MLIEAWDGFHFLIMTGTFKIPNTFWPLDPSFNTKILYTIPEAPLNICFKIFLYISEFWISQILAMLGPTGTEQIMKIRIETSWFFGYQYLPEHMNGVLAKWNFGNLGSRTNIDGQCLENLEAQARGGGHSNWNVFLVGPKQLVSTIVLNKTKKTIVASW